MKNRRFRDIIIYNNEQSETVVKPNMHPADTILKLVYKREFFDVSVMRNVARSVPPSMLTARLFSKSISQAAEKQNPCIRANAPLRL